MKSYYNHGSCCTNFDQGPNPFITNLCSNTIQNNNFRTALWTGMDLQLTLMSIPRHSEIGLEIHCDNDQFLYVESGLGNMMMGNCKEHLDYQCRVSTGSGIFIPANTWHNLINIGNCDLKLFSIYAPPQHPFGTIHRTKCDSDKAHH